MPSRATLPLWLALSLLDLDGAVVRSLQSSRSAGLDRVMQTASTVGNPAVVLGGLLVVAVLSEPVAGVATARLALVALGVTNLAVEGLKWAVGRQRPDGSRSRGNSSFPSSHAANAYCLAALLAWRWPGTRWLWWGFAALVAFSRVYLNRHFPSDVLFGALLGGVVAALVLRHRAAVLSRWPGERSREPAPG
jgi:membrane-associated phospholipid phosphatase